MKNSVRIGAFDYEIRLEADPCDGKKKLDGEIVYGQTLIRIRETFSPQAQRQVLWHEILHALEQQMGLRFTEIEIDRLAFGIMHVLRDNHWLTEPESETP